MRKHATARVLRKNACWQMHVTSVMPTLSLAGELSARCAQTFQFHSHGRVARTLAATVPQIRERIAELDAFDGSTMAKESEQVSDLEFKDLERSFGRALILVMRVK